MNLSRMREYLSWSRIKGLRYEIAAFIPLYIVLSVALSSWYIGGAFAGAIVTILRNLRDRYISALTTRIESKADVLWDVKVNDVMVGTINDADYAAMRLRAFNDPRIYIAQAMNLLRVAYNSFEYCFRAIPLGVFWIGVALAVFSPDTISSVLADLQKATVGDIQHAVSMAGSVLVLMMTLSVAFHWAFGLSRFGFVNRFDEAIGTSVRKHCTVAAEGSIVLSRWVGGGPVFADEMAFLRRNAKH